MYRRLKHVQIGLALLFAAAALARADEGPRLGARLRMVASGALPVSQAGATTDGRRITVGVRVTGGAARLRGLGFIAREAGTGGAWVDVNRDELVALRALSGVTSIERTAALHPTLDHSVALTGAPVVRSTLGLDGRGVVVGVVDTGIDFRHPDFRAASGATRLLALLDVATPRGALHRELPDYAGGAVWLAADIDAQLAADAAQTMPAIPVVEVDADGHGTHVAGIAAGNGLATGNGLPAGRYVGMAPGAALAGVRAARDGHGFNQEDVLAGVRFVLDTAARAGLPAVINLSLGGDGGPHDGTTHFEESIAGLVPDDAPGRVVVVSAGNSGSRDRHAGGFSLDGSVALRVPFPSSARASTALSIELWFDGPPPAITLLAPGGASFGPVRAGDLLDRDGSGEGRARIDAASSGRDPLNGRWDAGIIVTGEAGQPVAGGTWRVILDGKVGRWDAWITDADTQTDPRFLDQLDPDTRADYPAYASSAISVGSYLSRTGWPTADGRTITRAGVLGRPSTFTGTGPTADGRFFPDVCAPGDFILSALSSNAAPDQPTSVFYVADDPGYLVADDGLHGALRGTSQAAPHVAGAVALLLQADPTLTPHRLRELLRTSAALDAGEPGYSTRFGFGRLDVARAVALLHRAAAGPLDPARSSVGVSRDAVPPGTRVTVSVVPRDASGAPLGPGHSVTIESDGGRFDGPERALGEGRWERVLIADAPLGTALTIGAHVNGVPLAAQPVVWAVAAREDVGHPYTAVASACALAPRAATAAPVALLLGALALLALRRRAATRSRRAPAGR